MQLNRFARWRGLDLDTLEHAHIVANGRDIRIRGTIIGPDFGLYYRLKLDQTAATRAIRIEHTDGRTLELFGDGAGSWSDDRAEPLPALRGCIDVDLWPSPVTNALPLWRTGLPPGSPTRFAMAWVDATAMTVQRAEQTYTRLDDSTLRFSSADFESILSIDQDGLVTDYPGLFTAVS